MYKDIKKSLQAFMLIQVLIVVLIAIVNFGNLDAIAQVANSSVVIGVGIIGILLAGNNFYRANKEWTQLKIINKNQREIGLVGFYFILFHIITRQLEFYIYHQGTLFIVVNIMLTSVVYIFMWGTSFKPTQKIIKKWKKYHQVVWATPALILAHTYIAKGEVNILVLAVLLVTLGSCIYSLRKIGKNKRNVKQLQYIIIGMSIAIVQVLLSFIF